MASRIAAPVIWGRRSPGPALGLNSDVVIRNQLPKPAVLISAMLNAVMPVASGVSREDGDLRAEVGWSCRG